MNITTSFVSMQNIYFAIQIGQLLAVIMISDQKWIKWWNIFDTRHYEQERIQYSHLFVSSTSSCSIGIEIFNRLFFSRGYCGNLFVGIFWLYRRQLSWLDILVFTWDWPRLIFHWHGYNTGNEKNRNWLIIDASETKLSKWRENDTISEVSFNMLKKFYHQDMYF